MLKLRRIQEKRKHSINHPMSMVPTCLEPTASTVNWLTKLLKSTHIAKSFMDEYVCIYIYMYACTHIFTQGS